MTWKQLDSILGFKNRLLIITLGILGPTSAVADFNRDCRNFQMSMYRHAAFDISDFAEQVSAGEDASFELSFSTSDGQALEAWDHVTVYYRFLNNIVGSTQIEVPYKLVTSGEAGPTWVTVKIPANTVGVYSN